MKKVLMLSSLYLVCVVAVAQTRVVDSLKQTLNTRADAEKIDVYQEIITKLWLNHPDEAMTYAKEAVSLSQRIDDARSKSIAYRLLGAVYYYKGNYDSTIKYSFIAFEYSKKVGDSTLISSSMNNIGLAFYNMGSYPEGLDYLLRALLLKERIHQEYGMAQTVNNVGLVYTELSDYQRARSYFLRAKKLAVEKKDRNQELYAINNIGYTYLKQEEYDTAEVQFKLALSIAPEVKNPNWHAVAYSGLAQVCLATNRVAEAKSLFGQSLRLRRSISDQSGIAEVYSFLGKVFTLEGRLDSAFYYLHRSQRIAKTIRDRDQIMLNYDMLKEVYSARQRYDSALYYQTQYISVRDSIFNENMARNIQGIQVKMERNQAQSQLAAKDSEIRKFTMQTYVLLAMIAVSLVFSVFLYRAYKDHRRLTRDLVKTNAEILSQKEEIHQQRDKLALSHEELEAAKDIITQKNIELSKLNWQLQNTVDKRTKELHRVNEELKVTSIELENFIYRSSHDIRGPLVRLLGICHVALLDIREERAREYIGMLFEAAQQLNDIFDRLKVVSHVNDAEITPVKVDFGHLLTRVVDRLKTMEGFNEVEIRCENLVNEWYSDPFLLELILFNMIENAIRFQKKSSSAGKFVKIRTMQNGHFLKLAVIDNGIGISDSVSQNLYQMFSKAARDHRNIGLGLYIVKQCIGKLNGSIRLVDNPEGFTEFEILHPISS